MKLLWFIVVIDFYSFQFLLKQICCFYNFLVYLSKVSYPLVIRFTANQSPLKFPSFYLSDPLLRVMAYVSHGYHLHVSNMHNATKYYINSRKTWKTCEQLCQYLLKSSTNVDEIVTGLNSFRLRRSEEDTSCLVAFPHSPIHIASISGSTMFVSKFYFRSSYFIWDYSQLSSLSDPYNPSQILLQYPTHTSQQLIVFWKPLIHTRVYTFMMQVRYSPACFFEYFLPSSLRTSVLRLN